MSASIFHFSKACMKRSNFSDKLGQFKNELDNNLKKNFVSSNNCSFFTLETDAKKSPFLLECFKKLNIDYINLGEQKYFNFIREKYPLSSCKHPVVGKLPQWDFTYIWKWLALYHYLKNNRAKKYFFCLDQRDCYLTDHPEKQIDAFLANDCNLLFNAECRCVYFPVSVRMNEEYGNVNKYFANYGDVKRFEQETYLPTARRERNGEDKSCYLNGGCFVGYTDYFYSFLEKYYHFVSEFLNLDDQVMMHHFHFAYYPEIKIDNKCEIFERVRNL